MLTRPALAAVALAVLLLSVACGGGSSEPPTTPPSSSTTGGSIFVSGSSTVEPVSLAVAEDFRLLDPSFGYTVEGPGTGDGFAKFCAGETDVANASRAIREAEVEDCADNQVDYVELLIGVDALTVMTHPDTPVDCLTLVDLYALFGPESDSIATWQDAGALAAQLGSTTAFPADLALQITAPGEESGTYDAFIELARIGEMAIDREVIAEDEDVFLRVPGPNYTASANDNVIVQGVESGPGSLGFVGYAFYAAALAEGGNVKAIPIDAGEGCVAPTPETAADESYAITRPLFIYPNTAKAESNAALAAWVDFYLSDEGIANVTETGYVALPADDLAATRAAWDGR